jgi:hypothetical protein
MRLEENGSEAAYDQSRISTGSLCEHGMKLIMAQEGDIGRIVEIYNAAIPGRLATADTELATIESKSDWYFGHSKTRPLYAAVSDGKIIEDEGSEPFKIEFLEGFWVFPSSAVLSWWRVPRQSPPGTLNFLVVFQIA